jgi:hypothetical protein
MTQRLEKALFLIHGLVTLAASVVLAVFPGAIPATVGIVMEPGDFLLSYLLAAAELGIAIISIGAARLNDAAAIRLIAAAFAVLHGTTAVLELVYLATPGFSPVLAANILVRLAAGAIFTVIWWRRRS